MIQRILTLLTLMMAGLVVGSHFLGSATLEAQAPAQEDLKIEAVGEGDVGYPLKGFIGYA